MLTLTEKVFIFFTQLEPNGRSQGVEKYGQDPEK